MNELCLEALYLQKNMPKHAKTWKIPFKEAVRNKTSKPLIEYYDFISFSVGNPLKITSLGHWVKLNMTLVVPENRLEGDYLGNKI